ncbi:MAG TPA: FAD-dependent oxidoreductase [Thermoguttaceae bacterium]|nr:FAD-dependent oxidoreductase [Thermoguttaceae bacterium]
MSHELSRRDAMRFLGTSGLVAGMHGIVSADEANADATQTAGAPPGRESSGTAHPPAQVVDGEVVQPQRELPVLHQTDVLVVGAGPAGVVAALGARRAGAKVTLVERYGHFGGLWSGGLVLLVIGHIVTGKKQVCLGIGEEIMRRLEKLDRGIVNRKPGDRPTVDAEALKYMMLQMIVEDEVDVFLHSWAVDAVMDGDTVKGVVFESKSGRQAILADQVVDATGDGDVFAAAGAEHERRLYHLGLVSRIGNLDKVDPQKAKLAKEPRHLGSISPIKGVNWVNMHGPDADGVDVAQLSKLEMEHRRQIWKNVREVRSTPGYEDVYLMETAPQLGVRITRVLSGVENLTMKGVLENRKFADCVAVGGAWSGDHQEWQIPYGALLPKKAENVLAAGRCISGEPRMADLIRVIPICFVTGQAAGCAAALAVRDGCRARDVDVPKLQKLLREQEAYLG